MTIDFHLISYFLITFTAHALLSLSFLACTPLQQDSILVAEDVKNIRCPLLRKQDSIVRPVYIMCCGIYRPLSVFWIHPLLCILCIWLGASLLQIQSITFNLCAAMIINSKQLIYTYPVHVYIFQKHLLWRKVSWDDVWIFWCCNKRK